MNHYMIAVDLYLGLPILFYSHHEYFRKGINSFNNTADYINRIQPNIKWENLGTIVRHLYMERLRNDGDYDIYTYSSNIVLKNNKDKDKKFYIRKYETSFPEIEKVLVNNKQNPFSKIANDTLSITIEIPKNEICNIVILYKNNSINNTVSVSKDNFRVNLLRKISDFRDLYFSKNNLGLAFTSHYYDTTFFNYGLGGIFLIVIAGLAGILGMGLFLKIVYKSNMSNSLTAEPAGFIFSRQFYNDHKVRFLLYIIFEICFAFVYVFILISCGISNVLLSASIALLIGLIHGAVAIVILKFIRLKFPIAATFIGHLAYGLIIGLIIGWIIL